MHSTTHYTEAVNGPGCIDIRSLYKELGYFTYDPGFMSTASCSSAVTFIDGDESRLLYRGYPIEQLAEQSTYLEVCYLLLNGDLPSSDELHNSACALQRMTVPGLERRLRYCARPQFALQRLRKAGSELVYRCAKVDEITLTPLEMIAAHCGPGAPPPPRTHRHRYFGGLAPNSPHRAVALARGAAVQPPPPTQERAEPASTGEGMGVGALG